MRLPLPILAAAVIAAASPAHATPQGCSGPAVPTVQFVRNPPSYSQRSGYGRHYRDHLKLDTYRYREYRERSNFASRERRRIRAGR